MSTAARVRHEGTCRVCHTECSRDPDGTWYNQYGRGECKLAPEDGLPHIVPEWTERVLPPERVPAYTEVTLILRQPGGETSEIKQSIPEGTAWEEFFPEPVTVLGWRAVSHAAVDVP